MSKPEMRAVTSSMVQAIGYQPTKEDVSGDLYATFNNGVTYIYRDIPLSLWAELKVEGASIGAIINAKVKPNYQVERLNE